MANDVTSRRENLPVHLAQYTKAKIGNVDASDRIIPRVKLLQALSPELETFNDAKAGRFWHTIANQMIGDKLLGVPIVIRKSYILWAPRNDDRGILARAMDGVHWDQPDAEFTVKPKRSPNSVTYRMAPTVAESGLAEFGSSVPGDTNSVPAASLTYNMLWYFPELAGSDISPLAVIINTRSAVKPMKQLLAKIDTKPVAHYCQLYDIGIVQQKGAEGPYFNYTYNGAGYADEATCDVTNGLYERYADTEWQANDEEADTAEESSGGSRPEKQVDENMAGKF